MESFGKTGDRFAVSFTCCFSQKIITCIALSLILFPRWGIWNTLGFAAHVFCHDFFSVWINECWSDLACSQAIWPVLILTLLMVSQWIKTDWHCSIFDTVTTGWHVRDTLSLQMSSLLSSWKVVKSVWMFVRAFVFVCVWTCKKEVCGVHLGGKVVVMFFYFFSAVHFQSYWKSLRFYIEDCYWLCCLMISSVFITIISLIATI